MFVGASTRVVLVQHVLELSQRSNTGRHAQGVVPNLDVRVFGLKHEPLKLDDLEDAWVLWPGESASRTLDAAPRSLVVLDGSWSQARRMLQRVPLFRRLPRLSLPVKAGRRSLRAAPPGGLSTLESIAAAIELLEGAAAAAPIHAAHEALVQKQLRERGYVGPAQ